KLVPALITEMGAAYPELGRAQAAIESALEQEESRFQRTLGRGLALLDEASIDLKEGDTLPGETAFKLYDTYGFPLDLTQDILRGRGMSVDESGFDAAMAKQKEGSKAAGFTSGDAASGEVWFRIRDDVGATEFLGYSDLQGDGEVKAIVADGAHVEDLKTGDQAELILDRSPFYAESGGQAGDHGVITSGSARFVVRDVQKRAGDLHAHMGELVEGTLAVGAAVSTQVNGDRRTRIMANHSATHLMHAALRDVLGEHVTQKGSLVEEERMRFDFSHGAPVTPAEIEAIEDQVNAVIRQNNPVGVAVTSPEKAIEAGALALFGEKYGDEVRVLSMGADLKDSDKAYSVELCGGTHVERTGDIGTFVILSESGVSAGVRRIEVATGAEALAFLRSRAQVAVDLSDQLKVPLKDVAKKVSSLTEDRKTLERQLAETKRALAMAGESGAPSGPEEINGVNLIARVAEGVGGKDLRALIDEAKAQMTSGIAVFIGVNDGKAAVAVGVTDDLTSTHSAVDLVRVAAAEVGGKGGGGRPDMAQAGGPDGSKAEAALDAVRAALKG
ncbi:MAG: alanine--tRNA ligase, partial [Pseudomonadota bacterium]|nr:alanine--tRNA ligase [Pseudomonadota bacterium]